MSLTRLIRNKGATLSHVFVGDPGIGIAAVFQRCYSFYRNKRMMIVTGRTVSAYADEATADRIVQLARIESRSPAQLAAAALRLYVSLPAEAHQALRQIEALNSTEAAERLSRGVTRMLLDIAYEAAQATAIARMPPVAASDEDELLAIADRATSKR